MGRYLSIYRPLNIVFIALAQWLCAYYLDFLATYESIASGGIYLLILGTAFCAAFGYWINDFLDKERDAINKANPSAIAALDNTTVYIHLGFFALMAMLLGLFLGLWFLGLFASVLFVLYTYSTYLKNIALTGNIIVSVLCFVSLIAVSKLFPTTDYLLVLHFAALASFVTFAREMVKDAEDLEGDEATGAETLPVVNGLQSVNSSILIISIFSVAFTIISLVYQQSHFEDVLRYLYFGYVAVFIIVPLFYVGVSAMRAKRKEDYSELSKILKYILYCGILSILFF